MQGVVATWVEREACKSEVAHLMLGFALDLYQPCEYRAVYWYCDYLLGTQQQVGWYCRAGASAVGSSYNPSSQPMHSYAHQPPNPHPTHVQAIKLLCAMLTFWALKSAQMRKFY